MKAPMVWVNSGKSGATVSYFAEALVGAQIHSVLVDSEIAYIMLSNGTQITIRGLIVVQPKIEPTVSPPKSRSQPALN